MKYTLLLDSDATCTAMSLSTKCSYLQSMNETRPMSFAWFIVFSYAFDMWL